MAANTIVWDTLLTWLHHTYGEAGSSDTPLTLHMKSQVLAADNRFFRVVTTGVGYIRGNPYPQNWLVSVNVDLATGQRIRLADMYRIEAAFVQTYRQRAEEQWKDDAGRLAWLEEQSDSALQCLLMSCDDIISGGWSYQKDRHVVISLPCPHALGDYTTVAIPLASLEKFAEK